MFVSESALNPFDMFSLTPAYVASHGHMMATSPRMAANTVQVDTLARDFHRVCRISPVSGASVSINITIMYADLSAPDACQQTLWLTDQDEQQLLTQCSPGWLRERSIKRRVSMATLHFKENAPVHDFKLWLVFQGNVANSLDDSISRGMESNIRYMNYWRLFVNTLKPKQNGRHFADDIFTYVFSWIKMYGFQLRFHWSFFLWVQLTIFKH